MAIKCLAAPGKLIDASELKTQKAKEVLSIIKKLPYFKYVECRVIEPSNAEVIVFDADIEVGQRFVNDIRLVERIAAVFDASDEFSPEVLALREDFPIVPHLNLRINEKPRSLCSFEEKYSELKLHWTPTFFVERIREWLSLTSKGELHSQDQPLEPLLMATPDNLIIPSDLFQHGNNSAYELLIIHAIKFDENRYTFIAERREDAISAPNKKLAFVAIPICGEPQPHGIIHCQPSNLFELHDFLLKAKIDLLATLRKNLLSLNTSPEKTSKDLINLKLALIIYLPKTRHSDHPEAIDIWAFISEQTIKDIGIEIGCWAVNNGDIGALILPDLTKKGEKVSIGLLNPTPSYSRNAAAKLAGYSPIFTDNIVLIGCGALGSQVFMNLVRMGLGKWTLTDMDCLLPHNLARHALSGFHLGFSKAYRLSLEANKMIPDIATPIVADILESKTTSELVNNKYNEAKVIIDAAASQAVARHLVHDINSPARRISIFLSPSGNNSVMLAEDVNRDIKLDCLEIQYYRFLINEANLANHFQLNDGSIRYARSCRDISSTIPQDIVALHSALCSRGIRNILQGTDACGIIWAAAVDGLSVKKYDIPIYSSIMAQFDGWKLYTDHWLLEKIFKFREEKLPAETGGILIGAYDMQRKIVYVADTVLSPSDSLEWPTVYIRGCQGLKKQVDNIKELSGGMLDYIGEWHSHPNSAGVSPSSDDIRAFKWLTELMDVCSLPSLMMICGDKCIYSFYLGTMK